MRSVILSLSVLLVSTIINVTCLPIDSRLASQVQSVNKQSTLQQEASSETTFQRRAIIPETNKEAVAIVDAKVDDNMALHYLSRTGLYRRIHAVVSGVEDKEAAHGSIRNFRNQMQQASVNHNLEYYHPPLQVYAGGENPLQRAVPHEAHFPGSPKPLQHSLDDLDRHLSKHTSHVDVFHLGPIKDHDLDKVFHAIHSNGKHVDLFHSTVGYNNNQGPEHLSDGAAERIHLRNLHRKPLSDQARTVLLQSKASFGGSSGGVQEVSWLKNRIPPNFLKPVTENERFHLDQMKNADAIIANSDLARNGQIAIPPPVPGYPDEELMRYNTWIAREKKDARGKRMAKLLIEGATQRQNLLRRILGDPNDRKIIRLEAAKNGWKNKCEAETCDANHVSIVLDAHYLHPERFEPVTAPSGREIAPVGPDDEIHGHTLFNETSDHARDLLEPHFPPIFPDEKK